MLKNMFYALILSAILATPAVAQQYTPIPPHNYSQADTGYNNPKSEQKTVSKQTRFGWSGYCHAELHRLGLVQKLLDLTKSDCCGGVLSDECRVTVINVQARTTVIDGVLCSIPKDIVIHQIPELRKVAGCSEAAVAMICANKGSPQGQTCGAIYCAAYEGGTRM